MLITMTVYLLRWLPPKRCPKRCATLSVNCPMDYLRKGAKMPRRLLSLFICCGVPPKRHLAKKQAILQRSSVKLFERRRYHMTLPISVFREKRYLLPRQFLRRNGTYYHDSREVWYLLPWQSGDMVPTTMTVWRNGTYYHDSLPGEMVPTTMAVARYGTNYHGTRGKWHLLPGQFIGRNGTYYHDSFSLEKLPRLTLKETETAPCKSFNSKRRHNNWRSRCQPA